MRLKAAITTSSKEEFNKEALDLLQRGGVDVIWNPEAKTLTPVEFFNIIDGCAGLIAGTEKYNHQLLKRLKSLKVISRLGIGLDSIDLEACKRLGIKVFITPDSPTRAVAELVIGLIFNLLRHIKSSDQNLHNSVWQRKVGSLFYQRILGIIGFGRIGQEVAKLSLALGAKIFYYDPYVKKVRLQDCTRLELKELLKISDIISLHLPLTQESRNFIAHKEFSLMKKEAIFLNCARGGIVNEQALYTALAEKRIAGAAVDVFQEEPYRGPLMELENIILTPHIGSFTRESMANMEIEAVHNLIRGLNSH